ncbi:unnamed protein product [Amoebophrya sp. A25]|nr:unnamed protein product [Amoebophrya sp. A25]|eukprot:GSA25T00026227001.1
MFFISRRCQHRQVLFKTEFICRDNNPFYNLLFRNYNVNYTNNHNKNFFVTSGQSYLFKTSSSRILTISVCTRTRSTSSINFNFNIDHDEQIEKMKRAPSAMSDGTPGSAKKARSSSAMVQEPSSSKKTTVTTPKKATPKKVTASGMKSETSGLKSAKEATSPAMKKVSARSSMVLQDPAMKKVKKTTAAMKKSSADKAEEVSSKPPMKAMKAGADKDGEATKTKKEKKEKFADALYGPYGTPNTPIPWPSVHRQKISSASSSVGSPFKLVSWNVAGLRSFLDKRAKQLTDVAGQEKPDGFAFLETKLQTLHEPDMTEALKKLLPNYTVTWNSCSDPDKKGYAGVAFLARNDSAHKLEAVNPIREEFYAASGQVEREGRLMLIEYEKATVVAVYTPNSGDGLKRIDHRCDVWDPSFRAFLNRQTKPVLAIGDFNAAHLDEDIWNLNISKEVPKQAGTTVRERESFGKMLTECNLVDSFKATFGTYETKGAAALGYFSYWSQRAKNKDKNRGLRLDYCLLSKRLLPKLVEGFLLKDYTAQFGDHCPSGITLNL